MIKKITLFCLLNLFIILIMPSLAFAQVNMDPSLGATFGLGTLDLREILVSIVNIFLDLLGVLAIIVILVGGFRWMLSGGNEEKLAGARQTLVSGIIGLVIILTSFAIVQFVVTNMGVA